MTKISVVVPTYNRKALLTNCLQTLVQQSYPSEDFEILVCDDGSTDKTPSTVQKLARRYHNLRYLRQNHQGPSAARNLGIANAKGNIVALTDDDCLPQSDWLLTIDTSFKNNPEALAIEGKTVSDVSPKDLLVYTVTNDTGGKYWTCNMAYKRTVLSEVRGFDETFRFSHCEDIDLALRVLKKGIIFYDLKVVVVHPPRRITFLSGLPKLSHLEDEFYLYLKHQEYFSEFFPTKNQFIVFFLIFWGNHIWYRIRLLSDSLGQVRYNPFTWLNFFCRNLLEIIWVTFTLPKAVLKARKWIK